MSKIQRVKQFNNRLDVLEGVNVDTNGYVPLSPKVLEDIVNFDIKCRIEAMSHRGSNTELCQLTVETLEKLEAAYVACDASQIAGRTLEGVIEIYEERRQIVTELLQTP